MQDIKVRLGIKIAALRHLSGMTQEQLAERTEYSVDFISLVERGINAPSVDGLAKIAAVLKTTVADLFVDHK